MTQTPFGEAGRLHIGEQPQRALAGNRAGLRRRLVILGKRGMISKVRGEGAVALD